MAKRLVLKISDFVGSIPTSATDRWRKLDAAPEKGPMG